MEFVALGFSICALALSIETFLSNRKSVKDYYCSCPICQHAIGLSDETIKDLLKDGIPETHE